MVQLVGALCTWDPGKLVSRESIVLPSQLVVSINTCTVFKRTHTPHNLETFLSILTEITGKESPDHEFSVILYYRLYKLS